MAARFLYVVRCNFACPEDEREWNEWYDGPKLDDMLAKPQFATGQRFEAVGGGNGVTYLALWGLESPQALETPEYRGQWGFARWESCIADWSRDLGELEDGRDAAELECGPLARLRLVWLAGDDRERVAAQRPGLLWARTIGLDMSTRWFGAELVPGPASDPAPLEVAGAGEALFAPLIRLRRADEAA